MHGKHADQKLWEGLKNGTEEVGVTKREKFEVCSEFDWQTASVWEGLKNGSEAAGVTKREKFEVCSEFDCEGPWGWVLYGWT